MNNFVKVISYSVRTSKVYYPFFLAHDYTPLHYSPYYVHTLPNRVKKPAIWVSTFPTNTKSTTQLFLNF